MALRWESLVVDCEDFVSLGTWWAEALGWDIVAQDDEVLQVRDPERGALLDFVKTPDHKITKNRLHVDFVPDDQTAEVCRLVAMGATMADIGQSDQSWVVLADPEGNEFCVLAARDQSGAQ